MFLLTQFTLGCLLSDCYQDKVILLYVDSIIKAEPRFQTVLRDKLFYRPRVTGIDKALRFSIRNIADTD